jgi:hypothetical protein
VEVKNVGNKTIDYITVAFSEDMVSKDQQEVVFPEDIYEKDVFSHSLRVFWLETLSTQDNKISISRQELLYGSLHVGTSQVERYRLKLEPNKTLTLRVGIYGKKDCVGGNLVLEYGAIEDIGQSLTFYTRQLRVPFILTVRQALLMKNMDFLSKHTKIDSSDDSQESKDSFERSLSAEDLIFDPQMEANRSNLLLPSSKASNSCNLTFDMQNNWSSSFEIFWDIYEGLFWSSRTSFKGLM